MHHQRHRAVQSLPGGVESIAGVVRVGAFVNSDATFTEQPKVADAASELLTRSLGTPGNTPAPPSG
jgi:hypothetical protein